MKTVLFLVLISTTALFSEPNSDFETLLNSINQFYPSGNLDQSILLAEDYQPKNQQVQAKHSRLLHKLYQERGEKRFIGFDVLGSVKDFERVIEINPTVKPYHWQLGISYYLNEQFEEGKKLFELHKKVNPNDVENAVWHFICHAKLVGFPKAQKSLIPIQHDRRIPMMDIYELFSGRLSLSGFFKKIPEYRKVDSAQTPSMMYTYQYLGLYFEALGNLDKAKEYTLLAVKTYKKYQSEHYMGDTAKTHAKVRDWF
jgi:lipoprotein NlpI